MHDLRNKPPGFDMWLQGGSPTELEVTNARKCLLVSTDWSSDNCNQARATARYKASRHVAIIAQTDALAASLLHLPPKGQQTVRYYGVYSNKTRGLTPLIPDRIIRPPESPPNPESPISNPHSQILLIPAPPKQSARDMRPGEDARLQDTRGKSRIRDFIGQVSRHANESLVAASL